MKAEANDKVVWVNSDEEESDFVSRYGRELGLILNPAKIDDRFAPDLYCYRYDVLGDLKVQATPYRTANRYGVDPAFAVTLNVMDVVRYGARYGGKFLVYFWIRWEPGPIVCATSIKTLVDVISIQKRRIHEYETRDGSDGNKTHSFVLDYRDFKVVA